METLNDIQNETPVPSASSSSRLGIASLVLGVLGIISYCIPFSTGLVLGATDNVALLESNSALISILNVIGYCGNFLGLVGLVLGGFSVAREEKKGLGIAGLVINVLLTCGCLAGIAFNLFSMSQL